MDWRAYWATILEWKGMIVLLTLAASGMAAIQEWRLPAQYEATVHVVPLLPAWENREGPIGPVITGLSVPYRAVHLELTQAIYWELYSRTLADIVIEELGLQTHYGTPTLSQTRLALEGHRYIRLTAEGTLLVSISDEDPAKAAAIANSYARQLDRLDRAKLADLVARRKRYVQEQANLAAARLAGVEEAWQSVRLLVSAIVMSQSRVGEANEKGSQEGQGKKEDASSESEKASPFTRNLNLKDQLMEAEVDLENAQRYATSSHPDVRRLKAKIKAVERARRQSEESDAPGRTIGVIPTLDRLPGLFLENARFGREAQLRASLYLQWRSLLEGSQMQESLDMPRLWVLDWAIPTKKPVRILETALVAGVLALLFGIILAFWFSYLDRLEAACCPRSGPYPIHGLL